MHKLNKEIFVLHIGVKGKKWEMNVWVDRDLEFHLTMYNVMLKFLNLISPQIKAFAQPHYFCISYLGVFQDNS